MDNNAHHQLSPEITALISSIPEALSLLTTTNPIPTTKSATVSTGDLPLMMNPDQFNAMGALSFMMLQQQQMQLMSMNPFMFSSVPNGMQGFPALDTLTLANLTRPQSQSAIPSSPKQSVSSDIRPRAFSSAATLQPSMLPGEKRRKRSHQDSFVPIGTNKHDSVLRNLVETEEEPIPMQLAPPSKSEDERLKADVYKVLAQCKRDEPKKTTTFGMPRTRRTLIRDEDLPDTVGPDSPFRHHPKYQRRNRHQENETDALAFAVASGIWAPSHSSSSSIANSSAGNSPKPSDYSEKTFHEMLDQTLTRELSGH